MIEVKSSGYKFVSTMYSVKEVFNGKDVLTLTIPAKSEDAQHIASDLILIEKAHSKSEFVVKSINGDDDETEIIADLNLDDFNVEIFEGFSKTGRPYNILNEVAPSGWTVEDRSGISSSKTVELEAPTAEEVADSVINIFGVAIRYDFEHHVQRIYNPSAMKSNGEYVTRELNLVSLSRYQSSYDLVNRLYAYGKDGLSFADINGGKPYVDDMSYLKDRIRSRRIKDDRFTDKESLLEYAKSTLAALSKPVSSYECTPADIGATDTKYAFLKLELMSIVTLLDVDTNTRVDHQVVERVVWPYDKIQNSLTLSTAVPSFTGKLDSVVNQIETETNKIDKKIEDYVGDLTDEILTASGGHVVINYGDDGKMAEILLMDTNDKATAVNVMRFNMNGIAFSTSGYNGPFNGIMGLDGKWFAQYLATWELSASVIIAGILQSQDGETFYLDLENGILRMKANEFTIGGKTVNEYTSVSSNSANMLKYKNFENWRPGGGVYLSYAVEDEVLKISFDESKPLNVYMQQNADESVKQLAQGRCMTISFDYKVVTPFSDVATIVPRMSWTYEDGHSQTLYFREPFGPLRYDSVSSDWVHYEKAYTPELSDSALDVLGMRVTLNWIDGVQKHGGEIHFKNWKLAIAQPVQKSNVRQSFADDSSSVTINSGTITFTANTLAVDSDNFKLTKSGDVSITGDFHSGNGTNKVDIQDGLMRIWRKISDGSWREAATIAASGANAALGNIYLLGPGTNGGQVWNVTAGSDWRGGSLHVYNAAQQSKFQVLINGNGDAEVWVNGVKRF